MVVLQINLVDLTVFLFVRLFTPVSAQSLISIASRIPTTVAQTPKVSAIWTFIRVSSAVMRVFMSSRRRLICSTIPSKRLTLLSVIAACPQGLTTTLSISLTDPIRTASDTSAGRSIVASSSSVSASAMDT